MIAFICCRMDRTGKSGVCIKRPHILWILYIYYMVGIRLPEE
ncbi:hypothetical protein CHK_2295 [Christensenella hongkongensis]|uniref:Uncharacterized protein n=1 Tax=Christensenella hongkongensis TaxID=270498 RepID=A0A0M2NIH1_9FIRM|nr:hypothetical protein CHK_2295 [Christensenella hongkongensis]